MTCRDGVFKNIDQKSSFNPDARRSEAPSLLPVSPSCPFCLGSKTEIMNAFGGNASVSSYWCRNCRSPFEVMKWTRRVEEGS